MSNKVECTVEDCTVEFKGRQIPGVLVTCGECEHAEECGGRSDASVKRALMQLRENCPEGRNHFYVQE